MFDVRKLLTERDVVSSHEMHFGDEWAISLAYGLKGKSLKDLCFGPESVGITDVGWTNFSRLV